MAETILITGATGTVGSEVIKQLTRDRTDINIKASVHSYKRMNSALGIRTYDVRSIVKFTSE